MDSTISVQKLETLDNDIHTNVTKMVVQMAKDSENVELNWSTVYEAVKFVLGNPDYGYYIAMKKQDEYIGLNIVHFQYDIRNDSFYHWIGSLYIKEEYRKTGLFSKYLLPYNIKQLFNSQSSKFEKVISLYVDNLNSDAEKVYSRTGFIKDDLKLVFEEDSLLLKSTELDSFEYLDHSSYSVELIDEDNFKALSKVALNNKLYDPANAEAIDIQDHLPKIKEILQNPKKGLVLIVKNNDQILAVLYGHFEVTDWRNNVFWWIYANYFNSNSECELSDSSMKTYFRRIVNSVCKLNSDRKGCGVRFMIKGLSESYFENTRALKSHYTVLEKQAKSSD